MLAATLTMTCDAFRGATPTTTRCALELQTIRRRMAETWAVGLSVLALSACLGRPEAKAEYACRPYESKSGSGEALRFDFDVHAGENPGAEADRLDTAHQLLAIDPRQNPYRVKVATRCAKYAPYHTQLVICVSAAGLVTSLEILERTIPSIDEQLPQVISRWRFRPYMRDGTPTPFCYPLQYTIIP